MMKINKFFRLSADLICTIDTTGRFADVSDASVDILGYSPTELCGHHYSDFIVSADLGAANQAMNALLARLVYLPFLLNYFTGKLK
jgi:PAS domain S-box-containing protein